MAISSNSNINLDSNLNEYWNQNFLRKDGASQKKSSKKTQLERNIINYFILTGNCGKTRNELVSHLNIPRTTIYDSLNRMKRKNLIEIDYKLSRKGKGRPETIFFLKGYIQGINR